MTTGALDRGTLRRVWLVGYRAASDAAAKGAMFLVTVVAARTLSRDDFGLFALASTLGWLGAVVADFGIQMHLARETAHHPERAGDALARWLPARASSTVASLLVLIASTALFAPAANAGLAAALLIAAYGLSGLSECLYHFFRGLGRTDLESALTLLQRGLLLAGALVTLWWHPTLTALAIAFVLPAAGTFAAALLLARRLTPAQRSAPAAEPLSSEFLRDVAPIGAGIVLSALYFRIDIFLLEHWRGAAEVATYNAVFRIVEALRLLPAAVLAVMLPDLFRATDTKPLVRLALPLTAIGLVVAAALWLAADRLVPLVYGEAFISGIEPFRLLLLALPLMALNYALTSQLIGWHGHRAYAVICAGALGVNLLMNWQLIPAGGMTGAAWSTLWTEVVLTAGCCIALARPSAPRARVAPASALEAR